MKLLDFARKRSNQMNPKGPSYIDVYMCTFMYDCFNKPLVTIFCIQYCGSIWHGWKPRVAQGCRKVSHKRCLGSVNSQTNKFAQSACKDGARFAQAIVPIVGQGLFHECTHTSPLANLKNPIFRNTSFAKLCVAQGWRKVSCKRCLPITLRQKH